MPPTDKDADARATPDHVASLTRRADDIVNELDDVVKQMADLLRRRAE